MIFSTYQRTLCMLECGYKEALSQTKPLPNIFLRAIYKAPEELCWALKHSHYMLITLIPLGLYDQDFGVFLLKTLVIKPAENFFGLYRILISASPSSLSR